MSTQPSPPPRIPHAEFHTHLGSGGFADVYLYRQQMPERDIAVKVIRPDASAEQNGAFEAEANLMAKMSAHPAILSVFGAGVSDDHRSYLMMEYCPPPHLGARARKQQFPVPTVLDIGIRIAGAVETLHRAGVLHRDIKPANILITQFGHPVLTDFGIAVSTHSGQGHADAGFSIPWAPPEQATGDGIIGPTLDVYSLAATLHTLLTGRSPFEIPGGNNREVALLNRVLRDPVPPTGRSDVPPELERILAIAMAKQPEQRYPSVLEFAQALQRIQEDMHQRPTPIDVLEAPVARYADEGDEDATRVRAVTMIDPAYQGTTAMPSGGASDTGDDEATRAVIRHITPGLPGEFSEVGEATHDRTRTQTLPSAAALSAAMRTERWGDPVPGGRATGGQEAAGVMPQVASGVAPSFSPAAEEPAGTLPTVASSLADSAPARGRYGERVPDETASLRRSVGAVIGGVAALLFVVAIVAFGVWSYLRHEGGTVAPTETPHVEVPDRLPVEEKAPPVTGLKGSVGADGRVTFTWDAAPSGDYLYRVVDPLENHQIRQTKDATATVDQLDGRTCLEVFVRQPDGTTSDRAIECVDTP